MSRHRAKATPNGARRLKALEDANGSSPLGPDDDGGPCQRRMEYQGADQAGCFGRGESDHESLAGAGLVAFALPDVGKLSAISSS